MTWDGESYCIHQCGRPATVHEWTGMAHGLPLVELTCSQCATTDDAQEGNR